MIFFVTFLRALATCLITNAHYTGVYPTDLIANGGLIGDVVFFAVSGYCLYNAKGNFFGWYGNKKLCVKRKKEYSNEYSYNRCLESHGQAA